MINNMLLGKTFDIIEGATLRGSKIVLYSSSSCFSISCIYDNKKISIDKISGDVSHLLDSPVLKVNVKNIGIEDYDFTYIELTTEKGSVSFRFPDSYDIPDNYWFQNQTKLYFGTDLYRQHSTKRKMNETFNSNEK